MKVAELTGDFRRLGGNNAAVSDRHWRREAASSAVDSSATFSAALAR
jgi:hypothetical protein